MRITGGLVCALLLSAWAAGTMAAGASPTPRNFGAEVRFLKRHVGVIVLSEPGSGAKVALVPAYQGRIMTSTATGDGGMSYGWINHELIASGKIDPHFNALGGEDRFWLGPEGGQYGLFFKKGTPFNLKFWYTPKAVDTEPYAVASETGTSATFRKTMDVTNYSGTHFRVALTRTVRMLSPGQVWRSLGMEAQPGVHMVAVESDNRIKNLSMQTWRRGTGELSIWILGQFNPGPTATVVIPFKPNVEPGPIVNDTYFGKVPANRLVVRDNVLFFRADGKYRSKIGIPPRRALPVLGSYDADAHVLTLVQLTPPSPNAGYVNSMWEIQQHPYGGDAVNSYNDGPTSPGGKPLGPFYEMETSSPAAGLTPGASMVHVHRTIHLQGPESALNAIAQKELGVSLTDIRDAFSGM